MFTEIQCHLLNDNREYVTNVGISEWQELAGWCLAQDGGDRHPMLHRLLCRNRPLHLQFLQVQMLRDECLGIDHSDLPFDARPAFAAVSLLIEQALDARSGIEISE